MGEKRGIGWSIGLFMVCAIYLIREGIVRMFDIPQQAFVLFRGSQWLDLGTISVAPKILLNLAGSAVIVVVACIMFGGKREGHDTSVRNALYGVLVGVVGWVVLGSPADVASWGIAVGGITCVYGIFVGLEWMTVSGIYFGFGAIFGAAAVLALSHGFAIGGGLLFTAFWEGVAASGIGWFLGSAADFVIQRIKA